MNRKLKEVPYIDIKTDLISFLNYKMMNDQKKIQSKNQHNEIAHLASLSIHFKDFK